MSAFSWNPNFMIAQSIQPARADERLLETTVRYSICTIVTRPHEYAEMVASFRQGGFQEPDCEFLFLDNSQSNTFEAYAGYNLFLNVARGSYIILCHQDILLITDGREKLDGVIEELTKRDPNWAACGNAGGEYPGKLALRISDPYGADQQTADFPARVQTLDENFIVVRKCANLALSRDLNGFHFYGADICLVADVLGWTCYAVDFHLQHKSSGSKDHSFVAIRGEVVRKYRRAFRSRWITTTTTTIFVSGIPGLARLLSSDIPTRIARYLGRNAAHWSRR
jgi:hypothetical protein